MHYRDIKYNGFQFTVEFEWPKSHEGFTIDNVYYRDEDGVVSDAVNVTDLLINCFNVDIEQMERTLTQLLFTEADERLEFIIGEKI